MAFGRGTELDSCACAQHPELTLDTVQREAQGEQEGGQPRSVDRALIYTCTLHKQRSAPLSIPS